ncbi:MAG: SRPBCC domain-containing protein [bacterium]|nr:SRPBCC domain-containing protein [Gammaproteobacteria bacterium]
MKRDESPIVVEQDFARSATDVWTAITDVGEMRRWYFDNIPDFEAEVGFRTQFMVESSDRSFLHLWEVTEVVPQSKIVHNWKYEEFEGDSNVTFEVSGDDQSANLTVTLEVMADFPDNIPEFTRESGIGGWTFFINDQLKAYLDG